MFLLRWYQEYLEIKNNRKCESCETLKHQLEVANFEKQKLLERIMEKPEKVVERTEAPIPLTRPKSVPWNVRRQMLETEDRAKAQALKNAAQPDTVTTDESDKAFDKEYEEAVAKREAGQ